MKNEHKFLKFIYNILKKTDERKKYFNRDHYFYDKRITYLNFYDQYKKYGKFTVQQFELDENEYCYSLVLGYDIMYTSRTTSDIIYFEDLIKEYFKHEIENEIRKEKIKQIENFDY